jgi:hypothetical protein
MMDHQHVPLSGDDALLLQSAIETIYLGFGSKWAYVFDN